jgi:hypothetical protein
MYKVIIIAAIFLAPLKYCSLAQAPQVLRVSSEQTQLAQLLSLYYNIKDALVAGNSKLASAKSEEFIKFTNGIDYKIISEGNINTLIKDAGKISVVNEISKQRENFANLSRNMIAVAKAIKLTEKPIYQVYCPMKKTYWLSSEKEIKNPYYGSSMLTCGQVVGTL